MFYSTILTILLKIFILYSDKASFAAHNPLTQLLVKQSSILTLNKNKTNCCFLVKGLAQCDKERNNFVNSGKVVSSHHLSKHRIEIYTKNNCPYCVRAIDLFNRKKSDYIEINLSEHPGRVAEMIERSQRKTVPQIFIDHQHIGGCDDLYNLESNGSLDSLLS
jgi:glutaredoxin 3